MESMSPFSAAVRLNCWLMNGAIAALTIQTMKLMSKYSSAIMSVGGCPDFQNPFSDIFPFLSM
jgi:hypothetical protein